MATQTISTGHFGSEINSSRSFSVRVMAAECHSQKPFATFFSTQHLAGRKVESVKNIKPQVCN